MPYNVEFNDTSNINKSFQRSVLEGVYIGGLFNLKIKDYPVYKSLKNIVRYIRSKNILQTLSESQVRTVDDYTIIGNKIIKYYQIQIPYLANSSQDYQEIKYNQYSNFLENLRIYKEIDIFYYDRKELLSDYDFYFTQLDTKLNEQVVFSTKEGKQLSTNLRNQLPDLITEMMANYQSRTREAVIIISIDLNSNKLSDLTKSKEELDIKVFKVLTGLKEININYIEVIGKHKEWLFNNFISNITNY